MASITRNKRDGIYQVKFWFRGPDGSKRQLCKSLRTGDQREAEAALARLEGTLKDIERGRLKVPEGADLWLFLQSDGQVEQADWKTFWISDAKKITE